MRRIEASVSLLTLLQMIQVKLYSPLAGLFFHLNTKACGGTYRYEKEKKY